MKTITKSDIPAKFLFCLDMAGVTDEFLVEVNKQDRWESSRAWEAINFKMFIDYSIWWDKTTKGYWYWHKISKT